jgi:protein phosphatase
MLVDRLSLLEPAATGDDLVAAIEAADSEIREAASTGSGRHGMSTTCVALLLADNAQVSHVGDSRAYRLRSGRLERLTEDHSVVAELVRAGVITEAQADVDARRHLLTRALGSEPRAAVTTTALSIDAGDRYLLCSDGLSGQVSDAAIDRILGEIADPGAAADELVRRANLAGGVDNVTVVVVDVIAPRTAAATLPAEDEPEPTSPPATPGRAPGVAAAILLVLAVALLAGAIVVAIVSPSPVT